MYANYLIDVGKLIFIVGQSESTSQFRNLFQSAGSNKEKIFYKCMQEVPADTFKKEKLGDQRKGIIRKDWFNKILNKNPQMIVMTFNCSPELAENQVWQDRLKVIIKKINRVYDLMKSNNKQDVRLRIIILISKYTFGGINLHEKITSFLKTYEKQLFIIQLEYYAKELIKLRGQWVYALQKNYDNKYRKVQKRRDESVQERRLGCFVKLAILSQMLTKKDQKERYRDAYKTLRNRFTQVIKSVTILNHNKVRQLRAISDIIFLRSLKCELSSEKSLPTKTLFDMTFDHMNFYKLKNLGLHETNKYFYYQQLLWRCTFIQSFLQLAYKNDLLIEDKMILVSLCELLNQVVTYLYALGSVGGEVAIDEGKRFGGIQLKDCSEEYVGLVQYKAQEIAQTDIVYTFLSYLTSHNRDFLSKGIQMILRYKNMNVFPPHQLLFLNIYLLKFYIKDNKLSNAMVIFEQILTNQKGIRNNLYLVNGMFLWINAEILKEMNILQLNEHDKRRVLGMGVIVCDYFEHQIELEKRLIEFLSMEKQQISSTVISQQVECLKLKKNSSIASVVCEIDKQFIHIQEPLTIKLIVTLNTAFTTHGAMIRVKFNHSKCDKEIVLESGAVSGRVEKQIKINPIEVFSKDEILQIESIVVETLHVRNTQFFIPSEHVDFTKYKLNKVFTNMKCPQVEIVLPHQVLYINEVIQFAVNIQKLQNFQIDAKFSVKQEDPYGKTQVFLDLQQKINLTNCNYYQQLNTSTQMPNFFWLKCNKIGDKTLKLTFQFTIQKDTTNDLFTLESVQPFKLLKQSFTVTRQLKFTIKELFHITKTFQEFSNDDNRLLENKNIPVGKKILGIFELKSDENVWIKELGQHKNPKKVRFLKDIQKIEIELKKSSKLKLNTVFQLPFDCADEIELFLSSLFIKWRRMDFPQQSFGQPHQNLFLDHQVKINCFTNQVSLFVKGSDNFLFKKNELNKIALMIQNHSKNKCHLFVIIEGNQSILRVGEKGKQQFIDPGAQKSLEFDVLPVSSGFLAFPPIKVFVDGIERSLNIKSGQVIKCV